MQHISLSKLTTEQRNILVTAEKKRICEQRALHIVEMLLEPTIESAWLLQQVKFIDQNHYQDVTEERCVTGCCGYPLCSRSLGKIPKKQFQISTLTNRVYDISERKKFCSNACFRASRHLHAQIQTSPLWLRDHEPAPSFTLLDEAANRRGVAGDPVDLGVVCAPAEDAAQTTTDQVVTGMLHQFDELSERIGELGLRPEEESERQPGGGRADRGKVRFGTPAGRTDDPPPPAPAEVAPADQEPGESGVAESPADGQAAEASP
ncbi:putative RNA polymerase II subunit B1 CTD phosphatase RPAP2 homolog, partial [Pollicipes pollicipes]|uniref:putative RNA polymerase II subunit B1 CTD phosphatase RPAP2 homolog n=1 Tax=Pollicipes pollicipes TaxID=41117 RepID=UPI0018852DEA